MRRLEARSKFVFFEFSQFHEVSQESGLKWFVAMNGNGNAFTPAGHAEDMVTTVNSSKVPPLLGQQGGKSLTGNLLHKANSSTSEPAESSPSS